MNKIIKSGILLFVLFFISCSKDTDDKLEGKWQLREVGINNNVEKVDTVFYNFQTSLFMYQIYDKASDRYSHIYGYKILQENNQLLLKLDTPADSVKTFLPRTDWSSAEKNFIVEKISGKELILSSEDKSYTFRKF